MASSSSSSSPEISHARPAKQPTPERFSFKYASQDDVLEDLSSRFILNLPEEELASVERICFQVEQAHWYYEDFIREENPNFPSLPLKKFSAMLFHACPMLTQWSHDHEQAFNTFMQYKTRVPVCGAIMLNDTWDKCLLVKGWKSSSGWGFPKGKINQDEEQHRCAIREVLEETGYDLTSQICPEDCIEMTIKEQRISLYVVGGIPEDFPFKTRTRKEISKIEWFSLSELPTWKRNKQVSGKFYLISPFVPPLKEFIRVNKQSQRSKQRKTAPRPTSMPPGPIEDDIESPADDSYAALRRARKTNGSGSQSSSADNADPQTPSPQRAEAHAVATDSDSVVADQAVDPHFARLLDGLSLSAKKPQHSKRPPMSTTALPADRRDAAVERATDPNGSELCALHSAPPSTQNLSDAVPESPTEGRSAQSATTSNAASAPQPFVRQPEVGIASTSERRLKYVALLESVASESVWVGPPAPNGLEPPLIQAPLLSTPVYGQVHPGPSASVPPMVNGSRRGNTSTPLGGPSFLPGLGLHGQQRLPQSFSTSMNPLHPTTFLHMAGSFVPQPGSGQTRPMTSNAFHLIPKADGNPTLPSTKRHGSKLSMHQGNLLNILGCDNGVPPMQTPVAHLSTPLQHPLAFVSPPVINTNTPIPLAAHPLRVVPPMPSAFKADRGPLSAPLGTYNASLSAPLWAGSSFGPNTNTAPGQRTHFLSLLNSRPTRPTQPHTLPADATRLNLSSSTVPSNVIIQPTPDVSKRMMQRT